MDCLNRTSASSNGWRNAQASGARAHRHHRSDDGLRHHRGIEPDLALVKFKKLVGGGSMQIVNQTVPRALRALGYQEEQVEAIVEYIAEHGSRRRCARPQDRALRGVRLRDGRFGPSPPMGHVRMMAAAQPFLSGAISKTVNLPETATVEDIEKIYYEGWKLGLKALAIYRDNCKVGQPLSAGMKGTKTGLAAAEAEADRRRPSTAAGLPKNAARRDRVVRGRRAPRVT